MGVSLNPWEIHRSHFPCPACRALVHGAEAIALERWWCDPTKGGCGHFHRAGPCPEIAEENPNGSSST